MTNDAVVCEKCGGELEIGFVWGRRPVDIAHSNFGEHGKSRG